MCNIGKCFMYKQTKIKKIYINLKFSIGICFQSMKNNNQNDNKVTFFKKVLMFFKPNIVYRNNIAIVYF